MSLAATVQDVAIAISEAECSSGLLQNLSF